MKRHRIDAQSHLPELPVKSHLRQVRPPEREEVAGNPFFRNSGTTLAARECATIRINLVDIIHGMIRHCATVLRRRRLHEPNGTQLHRKERRPTPRGSWYFTVTKSGASATIDPLP